MGSKKRINDQGILWDVIRRNPEVIYTRNQASLWGKFQAACREKGATQPTWTGFTFLWGRYIGPWERCLRAGENWTPPQQKKAAKRGGK
jgi:hypothetical protein